MLLFNKNQLLALLISIASLALTGPVLAAPGDILYSDDFEDGTLPAWTNTNGSRSGVSS
ncbi:MAG: hypothetical protein AAFN50_15235 [Pseudomonadota bacterium]